MSNLRIALTLAAATLLAPLAGREATAQTACPGNPNALGIARTVEIDTTGGPAFGMEQYKAHDFLLPGEVVLTFDDGPWPENTPAVLKALAFHCTKATFFEIGKHALWRPDIAKEVLAAGMTVGTHTWSHQDLSKKKLTPEQAKEEIEKGLSAVKLALGTAPSAFFRFPALRDPPEQVKWLASRNLAIFSMDLDSFDFKKSTPDAVVKSVMGKLEKKGKGIVLMHDFQKHTAQALPELLNQLKSKGFKVVHMRSKAPAVSLAEFDEKARAEFKAPVADNRPTESVVRTIAPN